MKLSSFRLYALSAMLLCGAAAVPAVAEDLGAVKARMTQRLSQLDQLKAQGAVGETNRGLVEAREAAAGAAEVVAGENRDREVVYAEIAKKAGTSADQVGRARARQIAAASAAGVWLQRDDGTWYKK